MLIAGPCSYTDLEEADSIIQCAEELKDIADIFRCKLWLGGTTPERYMEGVGGAGLVTLEHINNNIMPVMTEVHTPEHMDICQKLEGLWIGARNSQNYTLLEKLQYHTGPKFLKRGPGQTIDEVIGIYDICDDIHGYEPYIIERGVNHLSKTIKDRWSISINDILQLKYGRPNIFDRLVVDCSHSAGWAEYIKDIYKVSLNMGVQHFMFEATFDGKSKTDKMHMISVKELKEML